MSISQRITEFAGYPVKDYDPAVGILLPVMPRREFRSCDGDHREVDKFWAITLEGNCHTVQSGTIGTDGETVTRTFPSLEDAQADYRKLVREKVNNGSGVPLLRREFHLVKGESQTIWEITQLRSREAGRPWERPDPHDSLVVRYGTIGPDGKSEIKQFNSESKARSACEQLVAEQLAQGYTEKPPVTGTLSGALYSVLLANPKDQASRMALADYLLEQGEQPHPIAYRVNGDGRHEQLEAFLADPFVGLVQALVIGFCFGDGGDGSEEVVQALVDARDRLPHLRALFLGDIPYSDNEISWINQSDLTGLLTAFPQLEQFRARGGSNLVLHPFEHQNLRSLAFEASNLPREVVRAVGASTLPKLEHLELWLGTSEYGANTTVEDLAEILQGKGLPALRTLALRNSEIADDVVQVLAQAPILNRLRVLDLSLGTLGDRGAETLLAIPGIARLEKLDIHHHYVSPELVERLEALGIEVNASDAEEPEDPDEPDAYRYVAHAE